MLIRDGGGGGSTPQVTSDVTVDPGEIQAYARFLAEMNTEVQQLRGAVARLEEIEPASFGAYSASAGAHRRSHRTVVDERAFLTQVVTRMGQLTDDTRELARDYADLDELNAVSGESITTHLAATPGRGLRGTPSWPTPLMPAAPAAATPNGPTAN